MTNNQEKTVRYDTTGTWLKGNTHLHSTASDGGLEFSKLETLYAEAGYDFLFATDHRVVSDLGGRASPLLWLDGMELDGFDDGSFFHIICLGRLEGYTRDLPLGEAVQLAIDQKVPIVLAHPFWSGNTLQDTQRWPFDGVEIYNHTCHFLNGKSCGLVHWNEMMSRNPAVLAFSVDDTHLNSTVPVWKGGWIVVNAAERSRDSISQSIRRGNYYSSCGPDFHNITLEDRSVHITTSPLQFVRLVGSGPQSVRIGSVDATQEITEASFEIPEEWDYAYLEIEDRFGKRAWTNSLFYTPQPVQEKR